MYRGTTPTVILNIKNEDFDMSLISECHITLKSEGGFTKEIFDNITVDTDHRRLFFTMSEEDTLKFCVGKINIQVRIKLNNNAIISSNIVATNMNELLEDCLM